MSRLSVANGHAFDVGDVLVFDSVTGRASLPFVVTGVVSETELTLRPNRWYWRLLARVINVWREVRWIAKRTWWWMVRR